MEKFIDDYNKWKIRKHNKTLYTKGDWKYIVFDFVSTLLFGILAIIAIIIIITTY